MKSQSAGFQSGFSSDSETAAAGVLMGIQYFHPRVGGAELQAGRLAKQLATDGVRVTFLTTRLPGTGRNETIDGLKVTRVWPETGYLNACIHILDAFITMLRLRKSYDIIHLHGASMMLVPASVMGAIWKKKVLVKIATGGPGKGEIEWMKVAKTGAARLRLLRRADAFVAISDEIESELLSVGVANEKIVRIPNGVDTEYFRPPGREEKTRARAAFEIAGNGKVVLFAGRLTPQKGVDLLLSVWGDITASCKDAVLLVAGEGGERENLETLAGGLGNSVRFLGGVRDMRNCYWASDAFVLPSRFEGLPNVLLEAMACGLPSVATSVGGIPEVLRDSKCSILVKSGEAAELRKALNTVLSERDMKPAASDRTIVEEKYSLRSVALSYLSLYTRMTGHDGNAGLSFGVRAGRGGAGSG